MSGCIHQNVFIERLHVILIPTSFISHNALIVNLYYSYITSDALYLHSMCTLNSNVTLMQSIVLAYKHTFSMS